MEQDNSVEVSDDPGKQAEKRTRKPKKADPLLARIEKLERALEKIATLGGHANNLREFGLAPWNPTKADMRKYK
jgi:hypothetical protein